MSKGRFTLPGESGYEKLTLELAQRWGADVIRDSDGTQLSPELTDSGYGIYSTICIIRGHNEWIKQNLDARQQTFLCTEPRLASGVELTVGLMEDFFVQQFEINETAEALEYMQVYDRTTGRELPAESWNYIPARGEVKIKAIPFHRYTVSFLAWRVWEEISMYNHTTNNWSSEHLLQLDPYIPKAMDYLEDWLERWCMEHPQTTVVRFTSLFYNFAWIWGSDPQKRNIFSDWASYDFTVSVPALKDFEKEYGYALCAEDFTNAGRYRSTHSVPAREKRDWMDFMSRFVRGAGKRLVDIVKKYGKRAYVFYDDSWVGMEPYNGHFEEFGFDGLIKCVFSGYEARLCAAAKVDTHEIRLHPYLFPVGLGGAPTFSEGGSPEKDAKAYWVSVRRALLRERIDRIGLGGYLHYLEQFPLFAEAVDEIVRQFHEISGMHDSGAPLKSAVRVGILTAWGSLRTWTLSGHFHETCGHVLIHIIESLSGLPFDVKFLSFEDIRDGALGGVDFLINAGEANSAWSGGEYWNDEQNVTAITEWVYNGGVFLGVKEPSAYPGGDTFFKLAHVLGADLDTGERCCHGKWPVKAGDSAEILPDGISIAPQVGVYLTAKDARVLAAEDGNVLVSVNGFGSGTGIYMSDFSFSAANTRMLHNLILYAKENKRGGEALTTNPETECAVFPNGKKIAFINNSETEQATSCLYAGTKYEATLTPYEMKVIELI